ncbi:hypothetical protein [Microcoleus sp. BROC3]|uniref:hypothetical protein n=1 Tax=Microcoleus sp. BROC3 TaxID=3055323 RepID=UPI002FD3EC18
MLREEVKREEVKREAGRRKKEERRRKIFPIHSLPLPLPDSLTPPSPYPTKTLPYHL